MPYFDSGRIGPYDPAKPPRAGSHGPPASKKLIETISDIPPLSILFLAEGAALPGLTAPWAVALLIASLIGYALVNTAEIAIVGVSRIRVRHLAEEGSRSAQALERLRSREDYFFATIVLFQNLFAVIASTMGGLLAVEIAGGWGLVVGTLVIAASIAVLGELIPKVLAVRSPDRLGMLFARPVELLMFVMRPVAAILAPLPNLIARIVFRSDTKRDTHRQRGRATDAHRYQRGGRRCRRRGGRADEPRLSLLRQACQRSHGAAHRGRLA